MRAYNAPLISNAMAITAKNRGPVTGLGLITTRMSMATATTIAFSSMKNAPNYSKSVKNQHILSSYRPYASLNGRGLQSLRSSSSYSHHRSNLTYSHSEKTQQRTQPKRQQFSNPSLHYKYNHESWLFHGPLSSRPSSFGPPSFRYSSSAALHTKAFTWNKHAEKPPTKDVSPTPRPRTTVKTKAEYLAAASGMFERIYIRLKLMLLKQVRPFNSDDFSAFFSWILVGNIIWVILGTTTFFSLVVLTLNTVYAQDYVAAAIGKMVTKETGINVVFEHAIVPHWRDGVITFRKVFASRRPGGLKGSRTNVQQGSQAVALASAAALQHTQDLDENEKDINTDDGNYTQFDFTIESVSVTLSFRRWIDGKGILKDVEVKGLRGVVDRRFVKWKPNDDPAKYKNKHKQGDFELESFKMEDVMFTLLQPGEDSKPFDVSIFNCELPQLRKHWLFYDFLNANNISGSYDNSLFTIHRRQMPQLNGAYGESEASSPWKRVSRLRIDNVDVKHLNRGVEGPFGWIESGNVDMVADVMLPADEDLKLSEVVQDIVERWEATLSKRVHRNRHISPEHMTKANSSSVDTNSTSDNTSESSDVITSVEERARERQSHKYLVINLRVQLNNTRAAVPLFNSDLTYINNALIRPIVAYINSRDTYIPINCRVVKKLSDFDGSWTVYDSHLMDDISAEVYEAFVRSISDEEERARRLRKVSFWSLQLAAQLFLLSLGIMV